MKTVNIFNGTHYGKPISGTFELIKVNFSTPDWKAHLGDGRLIVNLNGVAKAIWVKHGEYEIIDGENTNVMDVQVDSSSTLSTLATNVSIAPIVKETKEEMRERIGKRFRVMDVMTNGIINKTIRSLIISGAPGIGKTFTLNRELQNANDSGLINYTIINGKMSPLGLYKRMFECSGKNDVLVLDDVDVFSSEDSLNLLKAALDTSEQRTVSWSTATSYLEENDIPNTFEFEGTIVFITNVDVDKELDRGSKLAPHLSALISRSVYLDLGVHSNEEIMIRVEDVITKTTMMFKAGLTEFETMNILDWMNENISSLRNVSLRTALYLASFIKTDSNNWKEMAEVTLLR